MEVEDRIELTDASIREASRLGIALLSVEDRRLDGRHVHVNGREGINFSSCSYLGLETDERLKRGAIDATNRYGTQFSSSRTYLSVSLYQELEALLDRIFGGYTLVTPSTTLGHIAALPILVGERDAVVLDHQVHHSVQLTVPQLRGQGSHVEFLRHGNTNLLADRVRELSRSHRRVWYLADGVYSMYGDFAPASELSALLDQYENLHLYVDDAHATSWYGRHGRGFALTRLSHRERVVVAASLNKAFGAGGGVIVFPDETWRDRVRRCGGPMVFTGPIQPPMLGAAIASARIHLSDEIRPLQSALLDRIRLANDLAHELGLPLVSDSEVPIRYLGLGRAGSAHDMTCHLRDRGFLVNTAVFPAVGPKCSGVRFMLNCHQSLDDIRQLLEEIAERLPETLAREGRTREQILRAFGVHPARATRAPEPLPAGPGVVTR
jgi:7-keto-8-aminopelargonate synthetase-like enzyme